MKIPVEWLNFSLFINYPIPGIIIFTVLGLGSLVIAFTGIRKYSYYYLLLSIMGNALFLWIVMQVLMLQFTHNFHYIYGGLGVLQFLTGFIPRVPRKENNVELENPSLQKKKIFPEMIGEKGRVTFLLCSIKLIFAVNNPNNALDQQTKN